MDEQSDHAPVENLGQVVFGERIRPSPYKVTNSIVNVQYTRTPRMLYFHFRILLIDIRSRILHVVYFCEILVHVETFLISIIIST